MDTIPRTGLTVKSRRILDKEKSVGALDITEDNGYLGKIRRHFQCSDCWLDRNKIRWKAIGKGSEKRDLRHLKDTTTRANTND